ncbi:MAG TPA: hypothetical protein VLA34_02155, partial [Candidatus Krumholzibacterium sp.]|nr:hypothetical protein [Candidatus Krumholzibacterium sp.]
IKRILIDERSSGDDMTSRVTGLLPGAERVTIPPVEPPYTDIAVGPGALLLTRHPGSFVKDFPVTPGAPPCGEKYIVTLLNCPFSCSYCYLQSYLEHGHIIVFTNTGRMKDEIASAIAGERPSRMTTGEFGDSLALDHITGLTLDLLPLFAGTGTVLEARTKSDAIGHLIEAAAGDKAIGKDLVLTWTLAPDKAIRSEEGGTAPLGRRIAAIGGAAGAGIRTAVRFDPVVPYWYDRESYEGILRSLRGSGARPERFELGVLRFPPGLWEEVRRKRPASPLFRGEYFTDSEGKKRFYRPGRIRIYREISSAVKEYFPDAAIELSMEDLEVWEDAGLEPPRI